jgi:hypothetical protein
VVEFPSYTEVMANSRHPTTEAFLKELQSISSSEPQFRNLDVRIVRTLLTSETATAVGRLTGQPTAVPAVRKG